MKKLTTLSLTALSILALAACSSGKQTEQATSKPVETTKAETPKETTSKKEKLDEKGTKEFATYLNKALKEPMKELDIDYEVTYIDTLVYITLPQETKYSDKVTTQKAADNLYNFTSNLFEEWANKNGYRLENLSDFPGFYIEAEDGTILAELNKLSGTMEVKDSN